MSNPCNDFLERLTSLAEGGRDPEVAEHAAGCPECGPRLSQLRQIFAANLPMENAPSEVISRAKGLMVSQRRSILAGFLQSSLGAAGARALAEDFQILLQAEDQTIRLMYSRGPNGWDVLGRAPAGFTTVRHEDQEWPIEASGRFSFRVDDLKETAFTLLSDDSEMVIPTVEVLLENESRSDH